MRRFIMVLLAILYQIGIGTGISSDNVPSTDLGTPASESYTDAQTTSLVPWDMIIVDNTLYLGGGDYGANTGPVDMWCCDLSTGQWTISGTLNDEAIGKFIKIGDRVYAPGFDSKAGTWEYGNYHWLENGQWYTNDTLPEAVHNFDIAEFEGMLFFALGTGNGTDAPVKASSDNGETFIDIPFYIDGVNIFELDQYDYTRVYDFFEVNNALYCMLLRVQDNKAQAYEFYKYESDGFHFVSRGDQIGLNIKMLKQEPISAKATYQGSCYIAAGYLTRTTDFQAAEQLVLPHNEIAVDLLIDNDRLYVLCAETSDVGCTVRIYAYVYNSFFCPVAAFESDNLPASFAKDGCSFYIGLNRHGYNKDIIGSIHKLTVSEQTLQLIEDCM